MNSLPHKFCILLLTFGVYGTTLGFNKQSLDEVAYTAYKLSEYVDQIRVGHGSTVVWTGNGVGIGEHFHYSSDSRKAMQALFDHQRAKRGAYLHMNMVNAAAAICVALATIVCIPSTTNYDIERMLISSLVAGACALIHHKNAHQVPYYTKRLEYCDNFADDHTPNGVGVAFLTSMLIHCMVQLLH